MSGYTPVAALGFLMLAGLGTGLPADPSPDSEEEPSALDWTSITSYLSQVATERALDLPPLQQDLSFLRLSMVLAELCHLSYASERAHVSDVAVIELPRAGPLSEPARVSAKLLHFRVATVGGALASPQQYGVWEVEGLGLVVAFRGTASQEDVLVDVNITPVPLAGTVPSGQAPIHVHRGFYEGAKKHADDIVTLVQQARAGYRETVPVWVTGHSLGGGYANCLILHLLAQRQSAQLFSAGGGAVTFGAPQVVFSENPSQLYEALSSLEFSGGSDGRTRRPTDAKLHFHNFVNNADVVPRLLGRSLDSVHDRLETYIPSMRAVRKLAQDYHPFGGYHFILGTQVRTPPPEHVAPGGVAGHMGNAAYADVIRRHLDISVLWKAVYATTARGGGATHHSLINYRAHLKAHTQDVASRTATAAPSAHSSPHALFVPRPGLGESPLQSPGRNFRAQQAAAGPSQEFLDELGGLVGQAGSLLLSQAAQSSWTAAGSLGTSMASRWQSYWSAPSVQSGPSTSATGQGSTAQLLPTQTRAAARSQAREEGTSEQQSGPDQQQAAKGWSDYLTPSYWRKGDAEEL